MLNQSSRALPWIFALSLIAVACGDDDDTLDTGTGGGGGAAKGGAANGGGGRAGGSGGAVAGGSGGRGGAQPTGGSSFGGSNTGGANTGGANTGGKATTGGVSQGGAGNGGDGGGGDAGSSGHGGSAGHGGTPPQGGSAGQGGTADGGWSGGGVGGQDPIWGGGGSGAQGGDPSGEAGAGGAPVGNLDTIDNPGFELGTNGLKPPVNWTVTGSTDAVQTRHNQPSAKTGWGYLDIWDDVDYTVTVSQVISPVPPGSYSLTVWRRGGGYSTQYVFVKGHNGLDPDDELDADTDAEHTTYTAVTISPIVVTAGSTGLTIGVYSSTSAESWSAWDDFTLTRLP